MMEPIRLQKFIGDCGLMSRRAAEAEISAGHVTVNGIPATLGDKIDPGTDEVALNGVPVRPRANSASPGYTYLLLNKPAGFVTTMSDQAGRKTVADLLKNVGHRVYPVGRLDLYSDGLLLCTDDGDLTNRIMHPSHHVPKRYIAAINGLLTDEDIAVLGVPFELDGYMLQPYEVALVRYVKDGGIPKTLVQFTLYEGRNREIRKICSHYGCKISRLTRIAIGELTIHGIAPGKWRLLTDEEITYLKSL